MMRRRIIGLIALVTLLAAPATAQQENPVYVDSSPRGLELLRRAREQATDNVGESIRLYQELLDEHGLQLAPILDGDDHHHVAIRKLVLTDIRRSPQLQERYAQIAEPEAARLLAGGDLEDAALRRTLTDSGLTAMLRLAQRQLEAGRLDRAGFWLRESGNHPLFDDDRRAHHLLMTAMWHHYRGETVARDEAAVALEAIGRPGRAGVALLDRLRAAPLVAAEEPSEVLSFDDLVPEAIWSVDLEDAPINRGIVDMVQSGRSRNVPLVRTDGIYQTVLPTVQGSTVYVNQGHMISAFDRFTGRPLWSDPFIDPPVDRGFERDGDRLQDLNVVTVEGNILVTLTGHATTTGRTDGGEIVCLDARTGERRWTRSLHRIGGDADHEGLFPHGRPLIVHDQVIVLGRRVNRQLLSSAYLLSLDLHTGTLRWSRHIASSGGLRSSGRPFSSVTLKDGDLYVATSLGAIARVDAGTGMISWLRRYNVPITNTQQAGTARPWEIAEPIVHEDVVVAMRPDRQKVVILDRETGDRVNDYGATVTEPWNEPYYLVGDDRAVYAVGAEVRAFHHGYYEQPMWQLDADALGGRTIQGRIQLIQNMMILPIEDGVLVVDCETGEIEREIPVETPGNVVARGPQLVNASESRLGVYMSFGRAEAMLRDRIVAASTDPDPALSLLRLGMRVERPELVIEAAELALAAIEASPSSPAVDQDQHDLFAMLLVAAQGNMAEHPDAERLFGLLDTVAREPVERVEYLLAKGDWLSGNTPELAVEAYQSLLDDARLASTPREHRDRTRVASAWIIDRLATLVDERGREVLAPIEAFARERLDTLLMQDDTDPNTLLAIASRFPMTDAGADAVHEAARRYVESDEWPRGVAAYLDAYTRTPNAATAARLLGSCVTLLESEGWSSRARSILERVAARHPETLLAYPGGERTAAAWLSETPLPRRPDVGPFAGTFSELEGAIVPAHRLASDAMPVDQFLVKTLGKQLRCVRAEDLAVRWSIGMDDPNVPEILRFDDDGILLWCEGSTPNPYVAQLDPVDGFVVWQSAGIDDLIDDPMQLIRERGVRQVMPNGQPLDLSQVIPLLHGNRLVMVERSGIALSFDLDDPSDVAWMLPADRTHTHVFDALLTDEALVVAGADRTRRLPRREMYASIVRIIDPETGEITRTMHPMGGSPLRWIEAGPFGELICGTDAGIEAYHMLSGRTLWAYDGAPGQRSHVGQRYGDRIVVVSDKWVLNSIDASSGAITGPFSMPLRQDVGGSDLRALLTDDLGLFAMYSKRVVRFDERGAILGADVVGMDRDYRWLLPIDDRLVLVSGRPPRQGPRRAGGGGLTTRYTYELYLLSDNCRLLGDAVLIPSMYRPLQHTAIVDGWLLASTEEATLAIPMPTNAD